MLNGSTRGCHYYHFLKNKLWEPSPYLKKRGEDIVSSSLFTQLIKETYFLIDTLLKLTDSVLNTFKTYIPFAKFSVFSSWF